MNPPRSRKPLPVSPGDVLPDAATIDRTFGLEPVYEPQAEEPAAVDGGGVMTLEVCCPYCGEPFETVLDTSTGSARYVEDCEVCCRPIEFCLEVDHRGDFMTLELLRGD